MSCMYVMCTHMYIHVLDDHMYMSCMYSCSCISKISKLNRVVKVLKEKLQVVSGGVERLVLIFKGSSSTWRRYLSEVSKVSLWGQPIHTANRGVFQIPIVENCILSTIMLSYQCMYHTHVPLLVCYAYHTWR